MSQPILFKQLKKGDKVRITGFSSHTQPSYRQQLLSMGLTPNTVFEVIRRAPFGDPIQIRVRNFELSLRQQEAGVLQLEEVD